MGILSRWLQRKSEVAATEPESPVPNAQTPHTDFDAPVSAASPSTGTKPPAATPSPAAPDASRAPVRVGDAIDYLATPAVAAYFDVREHETYYRALKRVGPRRDFHERLIAAVERFLRAIEAESGMASVDRLMAMSARRSHAAHSDGSIIERARAHSPDGVEYLALSEPVTFDSLKAAYRLAAKRNHPDAGGTHEAMVAVNEAFHLLHDLLREQNIMAAGDVEGEHACMTLDDHGNLVPMIRPRTAADYRYVIGELRFHVALDDWDLEVAARALRQLRSTEWVEASPYARDESHLVNLTEPAGKLAERLALTPWRADMLAALEIARAGQAIADRMGMHFEGYVISAEEALAGHKIPRVVVSHPRQASNALRLGLINESNVRRVAEKYAREEAEQASADNDGAAFRETTGFLQDLPTDAVVHGKVVSSSLVPEPQYFQCQIATLSDDQQAEYAVAFGGRGSSPQVRKYAFVRLVSLLESAALFPDRVDGGAAAREAAVIGTLVGSPYGIQVADAITLLSAESPRDRAQRATLLQDIMASLGRESQGGIVISFGGGPLGMPLTTGYFKALTCSLDELRALRSTGRILESPEERQDREAWIVEAEWLRAEDVVASERRAWAADEKAKVNPAEGIPDLEAHCTLLLDLGRRMTRVEQLQLGRWVDRLTTALMKAKRTDDTRAWIERWFALPERYRGRSPESESDRLRIRLARATKVRR